MSYLTNAFGTISTEGVQGLYYDLVKHVHLSKDLADKPTAAELRNLPSVPEVTLDADYEEVSSRFMFASPARGYPIVYNSNNGMKVGKMDNGDDVWAHIHQVYGNKVVCDRPRRAFILFQSKSGAGVARCLSSLDQIEEWDGYIAGECEGLIPRWCFVYDALVNELKAEVE